MLKVYTCTTFKGFWPVGAAAVVVAVHRGHALIILRDALKAHGLSGKKNGDEELTLEDLVEISTSSADVRILVDGDY